MEPQKKPAPIPKTQILALVGVLVGGAAWMFWPKSPAKHDDGHTEEHAEAESPEEAGDHDVGSEADVPTETHAEASHHTEQKTIAINPLQWLSNIQAKVESIQNLHADNERLQLENANLRRWIMASRFEHQEKASKKKTRETSSTLLKQTGSPVGRALASLDYRPPMHLLPGQLYTLGVSYFNHREDEKAAVIFTYLTELDDQPQYRTASMYVLTGVSWYRLQNLKLADRFFDQAIQKPDTDTNIKHQARARLWRAVVAHRLGQSKNTQKWLRNLVVNHPHAIESKWVNRHGS